MFRTMTYFRLILFVVGIVAMAGCNLGTPQATSIPTPDIPTAKILAPPNNAQVIEGTDFDIDILAEDVSQGISKVELYVDEILINDNTTTGVLPQYRVTMNWLAQGVGFHVVAVVAYRADGTRSDEVLINIEVIARN